MRLRLENEELILKFLYFLVLISLLFSGCSTRIMQGASPDLIPQLSSAMVANSDITCGPNFIKKGTIFTIEEIGGAQYKTHSSPLNPFGIYVDLVINYTFAENVLFLPAASNLKESASSGFLVYPNGKFAYEDYFGAAYNPAGSNWWLLDGTCAFTGEFPFDLKDYR